MECCEQVPHCLSLFLFSALSVSVSFSLYLSIFLSCFFCLPLFITHSVSFLISRFFFPSTSISSLNVCPSLYLPSFLLFYFLSQSLLLSPFFHHHIYIHLSTSVLCLCLSSFTFSLFSPLSLTSFFHFFLL
jgi:hypothetical protein